MKNHTSFLTILLLFITTSINASTEATNQTRLFSIEELDSIRLEKQQIFLDAYNNALAHGRNPQVAHDTANKAAYNYQQSYCRNLPKYSRETLEIVNQIKNNENNIDAQGLEKKQLTPCKAPASHNQASPTSYNCFTYCFYNDTKEYEDDLYLIAEIKNYIQSHKDPELEIPDFKSHQDLNIPTLLALIPELWK